MWTKRFAALFVFMLAASAAAAPLAAQEVFASGGALISDAPAGSELEEAGAIGQIGVRIPYTDLFTFQAGLTYGRLTSVEGELQMHPFAPFAVGGVEGMNPYAYGGYGRYFGVEDGGNETSVVPLGVGVEVPVSEGVALTAEVGGRWTLLTNDPPRTLGLASGFAPSLGVTFDLSSDMAEDEPLVVEEEVVDDDPYGSALRGRLDSAVAVQGDMMRLPSGTYILGLTDEDPLSVQQAGRKRVSIVPFMIDETEVTNADYRAYLGELSGTARGRALPDSTTLDELPSRLGWTSYFRGVFYDDYPVVGVTYAQAQAYCVFENKRLPTEAEWEYAARGGRDGAVYPWRGNDIRTADGRFLANFNPQRSGYAADGYVFTAPARAYAPNDWGLHHMSGNVAEWVQDNFHSSYANLSDFNPLYENEAEERRVVRGGSWASNAFYIGVGVRDSQPQDQASANIGFRCVRDLGAEDEVRLFSPAAAGDAEEDTENGSGPGTRTSGSEN